MKGEINITLRGHSYRLGYKYWPDGAVDLTYGYVDASPMGAYRLKDLEIRYQERISARIGAHLAVAR